MPISAPRPSLPTGQEHQGDDYLVTAIGSCRVAGPLRMGAQPGSGIACNQTGIYGYCHSSAEALQQVRVLTGEINLPAALGPLIAPSGLRNQPHLPSDCYFVEISSAKRLCAQGHYLQLNYLTRHFQDFFSDRERVRSFWQHARCADRSTMMAFLQNERAYWALTEQDRALLADIRLQLSSPQTLEADLTAIAERLPKVLFVTHFNATKHDGTLLKARADFISMSREVLRAKGLPYFDPSDYVQAFGPANALKPGDQSLTHFSDEFEAVLYDNWLRRYLRPAIAQKSATARQQPQAAPIPGPVAAPGSPPEPVVASPAYS